MFIAESGSEKKFKIGEYLKKLQARAWLSHALFARLANTLLKDTESARDNHVLHKRISLGVINELVDGRLVDYMGLICNKRSQRYQKNNKRVCYFCQRLLF